MDNRKIVELDLNDILPNRFQPRIKFNETSITELAESIREHGVIQPIVVRPLGDRYEIIAGERRYKASVLAGKETIQAIVTELNDKDSAEVALIENVQRQDLTPIEEAISYKKILDMGYLTQEELAMKLGKTQSTVANKLRLLNLDDEVQEALLETKISERHARSLLKITDKEKQKKMLKRIISERLTVRRTDEEIGKMMNENKNIEILDFEEASQPVASSNNNLNIPSTPIVDDIIPDPIVQPISSNNYMNPGFMDVDHIEKTAQDINAGLKPVANIDELLKPKESFDSIEPQVPITPVTELESDEAILKPGKFFNLSDLENETKENLFNTSPLMNTITTPIIEDPNNQPVITPAIQSAPVSNNNNFVTNFDNGLLDVIEKPTPIIPVNPEPLVQTPINEPISNQMISVPSYSEIDSELYKNPIEQVVTEPSNTNNLKQAVDLIRECAKKVEQLGLVLETEEYDFEDMYQVIFKITKK